MNWPLNIYRDRGQPHAFFNIILFLKELTEANKPRTFSHLKSDRNLIAIEWYANALVGHDLAGYHNINETKPSSIMSRSFAMERDD